MHGVIGPNGVCCGFVRPDTGTVLRAGRAVRPRPYDLAGLGMARTLQGVGLFRGLTVLENVMVGADRHRRSGFGAALLALRGADRDEAALRERARAALAELGADDMDELGALVRSLTDRMAVVPVEHHMDLVMSVCDRITVLDFGRVVAAGTPDEVRDDPAVIDAYLGEAAPTGEGAA